MAVHRTTLRCQAVQELLETLTKASPAQLRGVVRSMLRVRVLRDAEALFAPLLQHACAVFEEFDAAAGQPAGAGHGAASEIGAAPGGASQMLHAALLERIEQCCSCRVDSSRWDLLRVARGVIPTLGTEEIGEIGATLRREAGLSLEPPFSGGLPVEMWSRVLSYLEIETWLGPLARVSRGWFHLVHCSLVWLDLQAAWLRSRRLPQRGDLAALFARCDNLTELHVCRSDNPRVALAAACAGLPKLRVLDLSQSAATNADLDSLAALPSLEVLNLEYCGVDDGAVDGILTVHATLRHLVLSRSGITDAGLARLAQGLPRLETLEVEEAPVSDAGVMAVARHCKALRRLSCYTTEVGNRALHEIASNLPGLHAIDLGHTSVSEEGVAALLQRCHELRELRLSHCTSIGDMSMKVLADSCRALTTLVISSTEITDAGLRELSRLRHLVSLEVRWCRRVTSAGIRHLANCKHLRALSLVGIQVKKDALAELAAACTELCAIDTRYCPQIDAAVLRTCGFSRNCTVLPR
jgi:hypothetical protein